MKKTLKIISAIILVVVIYFAITIYPKYKRGMEIQAAMSMDNIGYGFIHMDEYFPTKELTKSKTPFKFPYGRVVILPESFTYEGSTYLTEQYLDSSYTQGLIIIQDDSLVYEDYNRGQKIDTRHISWSMAKSYISALFGIAMDEGYIKSVDQLVTDYVPELRGSGYDGVIIEDVLEMSSGVKFDETYGNPNSDIQRWFQTFALGESQDAFAGTLVREREPGTYNHYVSINTHVLGMILTRATGKSITDYMQEKIWEPIGAEYDGYWISDHLGMEMALGGLNITLRDFAKLGLLFMHGGDWNGEQLVPLDWVSQSLRPTKEHLQAFSANSASPGIGYGYQWWIPDGDEGEFMAIGVFNQFIYVNPTTATVIAKNSANENFYDTTNPYTLKLVHLELFREIAKSLNRY